MYDLLGSLLGVSNTDEGYCELHSRGPPSKLPKLRLCVYILDCVTQSMSSLLAVELHTQTLRRVGLLCGLRILPEKL